MSPDDVAADELLGAYALDAVDDDEREQVEAYLERSATARAELARLRDAVSGLATVEAAKAPPAGSWERLAATLFPGADDLPPLRMPATRPEPDDVAEGVRRLASPEALGEEQQAGAPAPRPRHWRLRPSPTGQAQPARPRPAAARQGRPHWPTSARVAVATACVMVLAFAAFGIRQSQRASDARGQVVSLAEAGQEAGSRMGVLTSDDGEVRVPVAITRTGIGVIDGAALAALGRDRAYQLWSLDGDQPVSLAVLGSRPGTVEFPAGPEHHRLALTNEIATGSQGPTSQPLAMGEVA